LGVGGRGWVSARRRPSLSLDLFISLQRKQNKSGVLLVFDFLAPGLRVNFSLAGKQSLVSAMIELKLFPFSHGFSMHQPLYPTSLRQLFLLNL
jgi:hypothetical protein